MRFDILTLVLLNICLNGSDDLLVGGYFTAFQRV
jgi:hypothetical protein